LLVLVAALAVTFCAFFLTALGVTTRAREVKVPDLRGQSVTDASRMLTNAGLVLKVDPIRRPDSKVQADHVLAQEPDPGTVLRRQRSVRIRVSDGPRDPVVPSVTGAPERTADITLEQARIEVTSRAEIRSGNRDAGTIVAQDPPALSHATGVALLVNRGEVGTSYVMPDLIGTPSARVMDILRRRGFNVFIAGEIAYPNLPPLIVVRQTPLPGYQIAAGEPVTLWVSK
jgi:serine/threonine-protein kinase